MQGRRGILPPRLFYDQVASTQMVALSLAHEGAGHGTAVVSEMQVQGRGREGRTWISPRGGAYASMVLHPRWQGLPLLSMAVGAELAVRLGAWSRETLQIKWPNDLVVPRERSPTGYAKVGGILTDVVSEDPEAPLVVVGVGINVRPDRAAFPPDMEGRVTFLWDLGDGSYAPSDVVEAALEAILVAARRVREETGRRWVLGEVERRLWGRGRRFMSEKGEGVLEGISVFGEARLKTPKGEEVCIGEGELLPQGP